ncbi:hypothetical protein KC19_3G257400 [Ceratodon purpureus]|uniref:Uncharacterized protein n=1 Tax=Ceratodon purpureus TaxID=3225 RepID=A0A8T0IQL4_CERPU|nr:hypothetical protein KC19_3G257400 [Ceratodon purpureus]
MPPEDSKRGVKRIQPETHIYSFCVPHDNYEQSHLPVWKDAARRRGGRYQHLKDAPERFCCLDNWIQRVREFQRVTGLQCPDFLSVTLLCTQDWDGNWSTRAILCFQAVANASGIFHPPRIPGWTQPPAVLVVFPPATADISTPGTPSCVPPSTLVPGPTADHIHCSPPTSQVAPPTALVGDLLSTPVNLPHATTSAVPLAIPLENPPATPVILSSAAQTTIPLTQPVADVSAVEADSTPPHRHVRPRISVDREEQVVLSSINVEVPPSEAKSHTSQEKVCAPIPTLQLTPGEATGTRTVSDHPPPAAPVNLPPTTPPPVPAKELVAAVTELETVKTPCNPPVHRRISIDEEDILIAIGNHLGVPVSAVKTLKSQKKMSPRTPTVHLENGEAGTSRTNRGSNNVRIPPKIRLVLENLRAEAAKQPPKNTTPTAADTQEVHRRRQTTPVSCKQRTSQRHVEGTDPTRTSQRVSPSQRRATPASPARKDNQTRRQTKSATKITSEAGTSRQKNKRKQPIDPTKVIVLNDDDSFDDGYNHLFNNVAESPPEDFTENEGSHDS